MMDDCKIRPAFDPAVVAECQAAYHRDVVAPLAARLYATQDVIDDALAMDAFAMIEADRDRPRFEPDANQEAEVPFGPDDISDEALASIISRADRIAFNDVDNTGTDELAGDIGWLVDRVKRLRDQVEANQ